MKPILIDDLIKDNLPQSEHTVIVKGIKMKGWQVAKPLNYELQHISLRNRIVMAFYVLIGKAIAVRYFCDMSDSEQSKYVENKIKNK
jgi:hypothetical protein